MIDTGGINARSKALFNEEVKRQAEIAIEEADSIVMVVDAQVGITDLDKEVARILLRTNKPLCLAVNKVDDPSGRLSAHEFYSLGIPKIIPVSASQSWQIAELLEAACESFSKEEKKKKKSDLNIEKSDHPQVAIVGRPNVGKSSLINYILDDDRCIVSPIPGTTRDSIDITIDHEASTYTFIDTAGIRRKKSENDVVDKFAFIRTERAIERADICLLLVDAQTGMTSQEKKIANMIEEAGKGCIVLFNKWDLVKGFRMEHCLKSFEEDTPFLKHCPKVFLSAKTGRNVEKIFPLILEVYQESRRRITTHQLNKFVSLAMQKNHPPMIQGKRLRVYYLAQVDITPPRFVLFVNNTKLMTEAYKKYLINQFRETYHFTGVPINFFLKGKSEKKLDKKLDVTSEVSHHLQDYLQQQAVSYDKQAVEEEEYDDMLDEENFENDDFECDPSFDNNSPHVS